MTQFFNKFMHFLTVAKQPIYNKEKKSIFTVKTKLHSAHR